MSRVLPPRKQLNFERRSREFLNTGEIKQLCDAARKLGRHGSRDTTMILLRVAARFV